MEVRMKILIYISVISCIYLINFNWVIEFITTLRKRWGSVITSYDTKSRGKCLYEALLHTNGTSNALDLPQYKFYTSIVFMILTTSKKLGSSLHYPLSIIKKSLLKDIEFQTKLQGFIGETYSQFIVMMLICWGFTIYSGSMLNLEFDILLSLALFLWQLVGLISFYFIYRKETLNLEKSINPLYTNFLMYQALLNVSMPISQIKMNCDFNSLVNVKLRGADFYISRFFKLVEIREKYGKETGQEMELLLEDLNGFYDSTLAKCLKKMTVFKFIWLCVFYLSSYLISVYSSLINALI